MGHDKALLDALLGLLGPYSETVAVYRIRENRLSDIERIAIETGQRFAKVAGLRDMRCEVRRDAARTTVFLQEGIRVKSFHASGAILLDRGWSPMTNIITTVAERADESMLERQAEDAVRQMRLAPDDGQLRFERLWQVKATGITREGERGPVALTRAVGAFRRYVGDLPVWGRASVFVELGGEGQIAAAGVDWRPLANEALEYAKVLSPQEGAARVLGELQTFLPGKKYTLEEYTPEFFALGYFSLPKRRVQTVMQPVYVGMFRPTGPIPSLARLVVVPATEHAYEPIGRLLTAPPRQGEKPGAVQEGAA
jgi:hypothetical protein